jgi:hypothetical protein
MCGGGSGRQNAAADAQSRLSNILADAFQQNQAVTNPLNTKQAQEGLPFMGALTDFTGGTTATSFAPARAQLEQRLSRFGSGGLPSGFASQARTGLDTSQARAFDSNMVQNLLLNQQAKERGRAMLNPLGYASAAGQGYGSIMNMPVQPSPLGSILGGAAAGVAGI